MEVSGQLHAPAALPPGKDQQQNNSVGCSVLALFGDTRGPRGWWKVQIHSWCST